jgi:hypothetical protein
MFSNFSPNKNFFNSDLIFFSIFWLSSIIFSFTAKNVYAPAGFALLPIYIGIILVFFSYGTITTISSIIISFIKKNFDSYSRYRLVNCILAIPVAPFTLLQDSRDTIVFSIIRGIVALIVFVIIPATIMIINAINLKKLQNS